MSRYTIAAFALMLTSCSQSSERVGSPLLAAKGDMPTSQRWKQRLSANSYLAGALQNGTVVVQYLNSPEYIYYIIDVARGDSIELGATSTDGGDPMLWLLRTDFSIIAKDDDNDSSYSVDSRIYHRVEETGQVMVAIADVYRQPATFTLSLKGASSADPSDLASFLGLSAQQKMSTLYRDYEPSYMREELDLDLDKGFSRTIEEIRINDEFGEPGRSHVLARYFELRDASVAVGGTVPMVYGILKGGLIYAVEMIVVEANEDCEWGLSRVVDAAGTVIGEYGQGLPTP